MATQIPITDNTIDFQQFVNQLQTALEDQGTWRGNLTTQTSMALIQLAATLGTFDLAKITRYYEDAFPDTVQSDSAIRAIAVMQGQRLNRKLPASVQVEISSTQDVSVNAYTQFTVGGASFFNRDQLDLVANTPTTVSLFEGSISGHALTGLGTDLQAFVSVESEFTVSDQDVVVVLNGNILPKAFGGLWNYKGEPAYSDLTHSDGRLLIQFGSGTYGSVPGVNDALVIVYAVTNGASGNNIQTLGKQVVAAGFATVRGDCLTTPTGGADERPPLAYKNVESSAFGTYASAVTKAQYQSTINAYPGIVDAITQSQREINQMDPRWMNVIRVSALTSSPWTEQQKRGFESYAQGVSMYSPVFVWNDPIAVSWDVELEVYCFNTALLTEVRTQVELGIQRMFEIQRGLLQTNFYESDLINAAFNAAPGDVSYVKVISPVADMIVTAPESPQAEAVVTPGLGLLPALVYAYGISVVNSAGEEGPPSKWVFPRVREGVIAAITLSWPEVKGASAYKVYGRAAGSIGFLDSVAGGVLTWSDDGTLTPTGGPPNQLSEVPIRYNALRSLKVTTRFSDRPQKVNVGA